MNRNDVINHVLGNMYSGREESGGYSYSRPHSQSGGFSVPTASSVGGVGAQSYGGGAGGGGFFPFVPLGGSDEFPDIPEDNYDYSADYAEKQESTSLSDAVSQIKDAFAEQAGKNKTSETEIKAPKTLETQIEKPWIKSEEKQTEIKAPRTLETQIEKPWIKSEEKQSEITNRDILKDTQKKLESEKANQKKLDLQESRLDELTPQYSGSFNRGTTEVASTGVNFSGDDYIRRNRDISGSGSSGVSFNKPSLLNQAFEYTTKQMKEKAENPLPEIASWGLAVPALGAVSAGLGAGAVATGANVLKFPTAVATAGKIASDVTSAVAEPKKSGTSAKAVTATTPKASTPAPVKISAPAVASTSFSAPATTSAKPTFTDAISQIKSAFSSAISSATPKPSTTTQKLTTQEKRLGKL